jgi:hypothetical protein
MIAARDTINGGHYGSIAEPTIERETAVRAARPMKPIPIPPYICLNKDTLHDKTETKQQAPYHSGLKKKKYWPYLSKKIPPPRL